MTIEQYKNNGVDGYRVFDENKNEYFIAEATEALALAKYDAIKKAENAPLSYKELRIQEYPPIQEQLDMMYWDKVNGTNKWEELIKKIKEKFPKG